MTKISKFILCLNFNMFLGVLGQSFDLDNDSAVKWANEVLRINGNPFPGGPTLSVRHSALNALAYFDALAPYRENTTGIVVQIEKRPRDEWTQRNKNLAILYAVTQVTRFLLPDELEENGTFRKAIIEIGIDPDAFLEDDETPQGIGIKVGHAVVVAHADDGVNLVGDKSGAKYKMVPYGDYTRYEPVNTAFNLTFPSRWQPAIIPMPKVPGRFCVQQFVTPHFGRVKPFAEIDIKKFQVQDSGRKREDLESGDPIYRRDVDDILSISADLTDTKKMLAELFEDKFNTLPRSLNHVSQMFNFTMEEYVTMDLISNFAIHDTLIAVWTEKARHDGVRPFSAVPHVYGQTPVKAWAGPFNGIVDDLPAKEWRSYLPTADHPEYPSASAGLCSAHAEAVRRFIGSDILNWTVTFPKGSSKIEPGLTPASDLEYYFSTWSQFERDCGLSRVYAGVHFYDSVRVIPDIAHAITSINFDNVIQHVNGELRISQEQDLVI